MTNSNLVGCSPQFQELLEEIRLVATTDAGVLIQGETGTGKELVARAIHEASNRRLKPFVAVNCAAIPAALLESDLFGHERGAFTGAVAQKLGRFQMADGGSLFLDEIGDLPLELQPKLLRALQEQQFERVGGNRAVQVDVRVIAATHQGLWQMVQDRRFRADLYYRLNIFPLVIPALRDRKDDIPLLVQHFVQKFALRHGKSTLSISKKVMETLKNRRWTGNIRELQNFVERAMIRSTGPALELSFADLDQELDDLRHRRTLVDAQRHHITTVLTESNWVIGGPQGAAARLGVPRTSLIGKMKKLGISRPALADSEDGLETSEAEFAGDEAMSSPLYS